MDNQNTTTIQNCGINQGAGGQITTENLRIINSQSLAGTSAAISKTPFRFNIPTPTRHFKGRKKTLEAVRDYFNNLCPQTVDCWERIVAVVGLGGMGKTETAYKFAAEFKKTFPNVAWINAETESSALASFLGLAKHLKLVPYDQKSSDLDLVKEIYRYLDQEDYGGVLFIFDNAIRLNSGEEEFGIIEYLPMNDLPNQRFPYVLITTQTHDWERRIETFQVEELSEKESLEFFHSCFQIECSECDELFKKLHKLLEGYPLVMNLAASQVDYNPKKDSVYQLKQQISYYIEKLGKEQTKILNEKMNRAWPTKYNKTLSNVWKLTFERIQQEEDGRDALELLQLMSFLPVPFGSKDVEKMVVHSSECPHPASEELGFRLKELFRVLERFYAVRILKVERDYGNRFECTLGMHRLVQLVLRQQIECSKVLDTVAFYFASDYKPCRSVNKSAMEDILRSSKLSQRALPYVGILACHGIPAACKFVQARPPETKAAATIWRLYYLDRGITALNENAVRVLRELIELRKAEERIKDRNFFGDITIQLLADPFCFQYTRNDGTEVPEYFRLASLDGIQELVADFILNVYPSFDLSCKSSLCGQDRIRRENKLSYLPIKLSKIFIEEDAPKSTLALDFIANTWFFLFAMLRYYETDKDRWPRFFIRFWRSTYVTFHSPDASQSRIAAIRTCLWNCGLAKELIQVFGFIRSRFPVSIFFSTDWIILKLMDFCMDGMDPRDERIQQVMSEFCQLIATIEAEYTSQGYSDVPREWKFLAVEIYSVWIKLFLTVSDQPTNMLLESLSQLKFLDWMENSPKFDKRKDPFFRDALDHSPDEYLSKYFPEFIQRFSCSKIEAIQKLVSVCRRLMEDKRIQIEL